LRYAVIIIAALQLCSIFVAKKIIAQGKILSPDEPGIDMKAMGEVAESIM
jgi:YQGE family putative transporter